jgi:hypothetical protein
MSRIAGTQNSSYAIGSPTRKCAATERELATGDRYVAALVQHPDGDVFERLDYAEEAWGGGARPARPLILLGFWRGVVQEPGAKKRMLIDDQSLLELFEQSGETDEAPNPDGEKDRLAFRFVLALILMRKRLLTQEGSRKRTMLVRARGTPKPPEGPPLMEVEDPGLDAGTIGRVTERLSAVISGDDVAPKGNAA